MTKKKTLAWFLKKEAEEPLPVDRLKTYMFRKGVQYKYYSKLSDKDTLATLLPKPTSACVLMWDSPGGDIGHFCLIWRFKGGPVHFFDPLGFSIHRLANITQLPETKLTRILGRDVVVNRTKYQRIDKHIQTCGRWCCLRFNMAEFSDDEFRAAMYHPSMDYDTVCLLMTIDSDMTRWNKIK